MNPATAFSVTFVDELLRCGLRDVVIAPGSRSTPLAMAFFARAAAGLGAANAAVVDATVLDPGAADPADGDLRLHVRIDERGAAFLALGLAKASRRPVAVLCTSGTAVVNLHPAVVEADESCLPLLVLTADRPPELRGVGANQTIDQVKLFGAAVRRFVEVEAPARRPGTAAYWRSTACAAWAHAAGTRGAAPGPVQVNLPLREPLVPDPPPAGADDWPEPLHGRPGGRPWTDFSATGSDASVLPLPWTERGVLVCGDGVEDAGADALLDLAERAGWPVLAEPSSGARRGPNALSAYPYLLAAEEFVAAHRPDVIVSAGRPGLSRQQSAFLRAGAASRRGGVSGRHVVLTRAPGRWADATRSATDVVPWLRLTGCPDRAGGGAWLDAWRRADAAARRAVDEMLAADDPVTEPRLARDLAAALPDGALLWAASSLPIRDLDHHLAPRDGIRVLAGRGTSGIDGLVSAATGAALAHQRDGGGPAFALLGDLALLHDASGLVIGRTEPRPDLCLVVANNDGGGIFSTLEPAAFGGPSGPFERVFGTPHGADLRHLAAAFQLPYVRLERAAPLAGALSGRGVRIVEARTQRASGAALRAALRAAAVRAITEATRARC